MKGFHNYGQTSLQEDTQPTFTHLPTQSPQWCYYFFNINLFYKEIILL